MITMVRTEGKGYSIISMVTYMKSDDCSVILEKPEIYKVQNINVKANIVMLPVSVSFI